MKFSALQAVRDRLRTDAPLAAYFAAEYPGLPVHFLIGLKPDLEQGTGVPADFFPYVAVSPLTEDRPRVTRDGGMGLSIMFGVDNDQIEDGVFLGMRQVCDIGELILSALELQPIATAALYVAWESDCRVIADAGVQHPYYEAEILLNLTLRPEA